MKTIVISGINIVNGGAKSVFEDLLEAIINSEFINDYNFVILVSKKDYFKKYSKYMKLIEFPKSKKHWLTRLYYEYVYFKKLSKKIKPYIWLSMHDITPNVVADKRYVYCHNPSPFYNMSFKDIKYGYKYYLFSKFYKYLYKINIKKNDAVIVQQKWMGEEFKKMYGIEDVIVAHPTVDSSIVINDTSQKNKKFTFIYPSYPRIFKNFELPCEAAKRLYERGVNNFQLLITLNGKENNYSRMLLKKYGNVPPIKFIGLLSRKELFKKYGEVNCLIFTSKLETWGMPISEFKQTKKPILTVNLPYAYETVGNYENVDFVDATSCIKLSSEMYKLISQKSFNHRKEVKKSDNKKRIVNSWNELLSRII